MNLRYYKVKYFVSVVLCIAALCTWLADIGIPDQVMKYLSPAFIVSGFLLGYDKWFWKWPICSFLMAVPNVSGIYTGSIKFVYKGKRCTKDCKMVIRQSSMRIDVETSFTGNNKNEPSTSSNSIFASIIKDECKGKIKLIFFYENQGSNLAGDTLSQHFGTNVLDIKISKNSVDLEGYYFTNRKPKQTMGKIFVSRKKA